MIFEGDGFFDDNGRFRIDDARRMLAGRLDLLPTFRQKLMEVPLGLGYPVWVDDPNFDLTYHVRVAALPRPGSDDLLRDLMPRSRAGRSTATVHCGSWKDPQAAEWL